MNTVNLELLYFWSKQMRVTDAAKEVGCIGSDRKGHHKVFYGCCGWSKCCHPHSDHPEVHLARHTDFSDEWRAYSSLSFLGYQHQTVNHSQNFVDPGTGAHTNSVEGYWSCVKRQMRRQGVMNTSNDLFATYLLESLWRKRFHGQDLFEKLLECIAEQYPL